MPTIQIKDNRLFINEPNKSMTIGRIIIGVCLGGIVLMITLPFTFLFFKISFDYTLLLFFPLLILSLFTSQAIIKVYWEALWASDLLEIDVLTRDFRYILYYKQFRQTKLQGNLKDFYLETTETVRQSTKVVDKKSQFNDILDNDFLNLEVRETKESGLLIIENYNKKITTSISLSPEEYEQLMTHLIKK